MLWTLRSITIRHAAHRAILWRSSVIQYVETPPSVLELKQTIKAAGLSVREAIREKGTPYLERGLDDPALGDNALLAAMIADPILINRPVVVTPLGTRLCRPSERVLDVLPHPPQREFRKEDGELVLDAEGNRVA